MPRLQSILMIPAHGCICGGSALKPGAEYSADALTQIMSIFRWSKALLAPAGHFACRD